GAAVNDAAKCKLKGSCKRVTCKDRSYATHLRARHVVSTTNKSTDVTDRRQTNAARGMKFLRSVGRDALVTITLRADRLLERRRGRGRGRPWVPYRRRGAADAALRRRLFS